MKLLVFLLLGICCYTDLRKRVISMRILLTFLLISLLWITLAQLPQLGKILKLPWIFGNDVSSWLERTLCCRLSIGSVIRSPLPGIMLLLCSKLLRGAIGEGDAYLTMLTGVMLGGENNLRLLLVALLLSAFCAFFLILVKKKEKTATFPFVPFLFLSYILIFIITPAAGWKLWL